jgi:hypothetical protein
MVGTETIFDWICALDHSLGTKTLRYYARFGGVSSADRKAPNQGVRIATESFKLTRTHISIGWLFLFNAGIPKNILQFLALLGSGVGLPLYIDTNHNDVGGDAHFM